MCSPKLSELVGPDAVEVLRGAITDVAERSFFTAAEPCDDDDRLLVLASESGDWLVSTVRFTEAGCAGIASCALPRDLARRLFDAFNGRDPLDPTPAFDELADLVGEFVNMICGAWLTRTVDGPAFLISRPIVEASSRPTALDGRAEARVVMSVDDLPLVVAIAQA